MGADAEWPEDGRTLRGILRSLKTPAPLELTCNVLCCFDTTQLDESRTKRLGGIADQARRLGLALSPDDGRITFLEEGDAEVVAAAPP